jgi:hypothetical protein
MSVLVSVLEIVGSLGAGVGIGHLVSWLKQPAAIQPKIEQAKPKTTIEPAGHPYRDVNEALLDSLEPEIKPIVPKYVDPIPVYPWHENLACPLCNANNMTWKQTKEEKEEGHKRRNSETHHGCAGCQHLSTPHLHVSCWDCKFKFLMEPEKKEPKEENPKRVEVVKPKTKKKFPSYLRLVPQIKKEDNPPTAN